MTPLEFEKCLLTKLNQSRVSTAVPPLEMAWDPDSQFIYGNPGDMLVAGDWNGDGKDSVGVFRPSNGMVYLRYSNSAGNAEAQLFADVQSGVVAINP
jgi:hypothetical protein